MHGFHEPCCLRLIAGGVNPFRTERIGIARPATSSPLRHGCEANSFLEASARKDGGFAWFAAAVVHPGEPGEKPHRNSGSDAHKA